MSWKIGKGLGPGGVALPSEGGPAAPKPELADKLSRAPDPSKAFLPPSPHAPHRGPESKLGGATVELERRTGPPLYQSSHFEDPASFMGKDDVELAKRLCHRIDDETWPELYLAFQSELKAARAARGPGSKAPPALGSGWWTEPWCFVEGPGDGAVALSSPPDLASVAALGFRNIALSGAASASELARLEVQTKALGLSMMSELELAPSAEGLGDPAWLGLVLRRVAADLSGGVLGVRTRGLEASHASVHALHALLKLFLRTLSADEILVPGRSSAGSSLGLEAGGALDLSGGTAPSEGDLIPWIEGRDALRSALHTSLRDPLDEALMNLPTLLYGARLLASLEGPELEVPLLDLVRWSPERLALAFSLLYFLPATPAIEARSARALPAGRATLKLMNRLRAGHPALAQGDLWSISPDRDDSLFWCRGRPGEASGFFAVAANLSDHDVSLLVSRPRLESAGLDLGSRVRPIGRARVWGRMEARGLRLELPPFGLAFYVG